MRMDGDTMHRHLFILCFTNAMGAQDARKQIMRLQLSEGRIELATLKERGNEGAEVRLFLVREKSRSSSDGIRFSDLLKIMTFVDQCGGSIDGIVRK